MTKTERLKQARSVRAHMARFVDLQESALQEHIRSQGDQGPEYRAMNALLAARRELNNLIDTLHGENYGQDYEK